MYLNFSPGALGLKANFAETIRLAKDHGFEGIDLPLKEVAALPHPEQAAEQVQAAGLRWGGFSLPVNYRKDDATYDADMARLKKWLPLAQQFGCTRCYTPIRPGDDELDYSACFDLHVRRLKPIAALLAQHEVRFGLEFIGPKTLRDEMRHTFIYTIGGMLELCNAIAVDPQDNKEGIGVLLDSYHWWTSGATESDLLDLLNNDNIVYVHVNDGRSGRSRDEQMDLERTLPCESGLIESATFMRCLKELKYDGPLTAEPFLPELVEMDIDAAVKRTAQTIRQMMTTA